MRWLLEPVRKKLQPKSGNLTPLRTPGSSLRNKKNSADSTSQSTTFRVIRKAVQQGFSRNDPQAEARRETLIMKSVLARLQTYNTIGAVVSIQAEEISKVRNAINRVKLKCIDLKHKSSLASLGIDRSGNKVNTLVNEISLLKKSAREKTMKLEMLRKLIDSTKQKIERAEQRTSSNASSRFVLHSSTKELTVESIEDLIRLDQETFEYQKNSELERSAYLQNRLDRIVKLLEQPSLLKNQDSLSKDKQSEEKYKLYDRMKRQNGTISTRKIDLLANTRKDRNEEVMSEKEPSEGSSRIKSRDQQSADREPAAHPSTATQHELSG